MGTMLAINGNIINSQEPLPIPVDLMTKLWENPSPASAFAAQNITLTSSDYDFLLCIYKRYAGGDLEGSIIIPKESNFALEACSTESGGARTNVRSAAITDSGLKITWGDAYQATGTTASSVNNNGCIPIYIYGFKKTISFVSGSNCDVEYKRVATGTTLDSLKVAIKALSRADYLKSYINIVDESLNAGHIMMMPEDGRDIVKAFGGIVSPYNASIISRHWSVFYNVQNDTITYRMLSQPVSGSMTEQFPNITSWSLYTLKPV